MRPAAAERSEPAVDVPSTSTETAAGDRAFARIALAVGAVSVLAFTWSLTLGRGDLAQARGFAEVFDLQARALLDGRLAVPEGSLGFEGFVIDGRTYAYFGIFPALLRLPVLLVTDRFDGRLTGTSMLLAYLIALWSAVRIVARVRALTRSGAPWTPTGLAVAGVLLAVVGVGSNLYFLSSGAWVYHEASLWGAAGVLASFAATLRFMHRPRVRTVAAAGTWAAVAWTSRGSVGLAPSAVLGVLGLAHLTGVRWLTVLAPPPPAGATGETRTWPRSPRVAAALLVAAVGGAVVFGTINTAKFGSPTALPMEEQVASQDPWPERRTALEVYDGSLFSARLIPSVLVQTLRPDLLEPSATWPFLRFGDARPPVWGDLVFDTVEPSAGLTVTSPLLLVLAVVGAVAAVRRRRPGRPDAGLLRPFLLGGAAATYAPLTIAFIAQRYLTDALPLLLVGAAGGVAVLDGWAARRPRASDAPRRRAAVGGVALVGAVGVVVTLVVTWSFQRFVIPPDGASRAAAIRAQVAVSRVVGSPPDYRAHGDVLPERAAEVGLAVRGDCLGLYQGLGNGVWSPVEVSARGGVHRLEVELDAAAPGDDPGGAADPAAVLDLSGPGDEDLVVVVVGEGPRRRFALRRNGTPGPAGRSVLLGDGTHEVVVEADPTLAWVRITVDGDEVLFDPGRPPAATTVTVGRDAAGEVAPFPGAVRELPTPTPTCDALVDADG
ncbi:MAG TPA: hypothetical protein VHK88_06785 [Aquihabitans sp.]|nr:hypothetical protein [Aquihabitans sp.]